MKKRIVSIFLALVLILSVLPGTAFAANETSGSCGSNATWSFNARTGTLTIQGTGAIDNYATSWGTTSPWAAYQEEIQSVSIRDGITRVGNGAFGGDCDANSYENLTFVFLPDTLKSIGEYAFAGSGLTSIILPSKLETIEECAFSNTDIKTVSFPSSLKTIGAFAFPRLTSVHIPASVTSIAEYAFGYGSQIQSLTVESGNQYYAAEDNVLYDIGKTEILLFAYQDKIYQIPDTVEEAPLIYFWFPDNLEGIIVPEGVKLHADSPSEVTIDLSKSFALYFLGDAPDNLNELGMMRDGDAVSLAVYYEADAAGWDAYTSKDYWDSYLNGYWMTFQTWTPAPELKTHSVSYDLAGGTGNIPAAQSYRAGATVTVSSNVPKRDGYTFSGWSDGHTTYNSGATFTMPEEAVKLTALWSKIATVDPKVTFKDKTVYLNESESAILVYTQRPSNAIVTLQSSDSSVVSISSNSNTITAVKTGTATVTATLFSNGIVKSDTCTVVVGATATEKAQEFVNKALEQVGKKRSAFSFTDSWCDKFIGWCSGQLGLQKIITDTGSNGVTRYNDIIKSGGSGVRFYNRYDMKLGTYLENRSDYTPQIGDIVIFTWNYTYENRVKVPVDYGTYISHVGIVCSVSDKTITVVHGNYHTSTVANGIVCGPGCSYCGSTWDRNSPEIYAYARPNWAAASGISSGTKSFTVKCPVEVSVSYDGETLNSASTQTESSFGALTAGADGINITVNNYYDTEMMIMGTGTGTMDFTATYTDEDGTVSERTFQSVPITEDTVIRVVDPNRTAASVVLEIYCGYGQTFKEAWYADSEDAVTSPDQDLTDWYLIYDNYEMSDPVITYPVYDQISTSTYSITIPAVANGTVTVSPKSAAKGATVTVTAAPDEGYKLDSLTVADAKGNVIQLTEKGGGEYIFTMPGSKVSIAASFVPVEDGIPTDWANPFTDIAPDAWYYDAVAYVSAKGLMTGTTASTFAPSDTMTRAMVWTVLARMEGQSVEGGSPWYALAQSWAMNAAVSDGTGPNDSITREQLITMLYRQAGSPEVGVPELAKLGQFSDGEAVSDWAQSAMAWAVSNGILTGEAGALNPQAGATRAQVAAILMRFCQQ